MDARTLQTYRHHTGWTPQSLAAGLAHLNAKFKTLLGQG